MANTFILKKHGIHPIGSAYIEFNAVRATSHDLKRGLFRKPAHQGEYQLLSSVRKQEYRLNYEVLDVRNVFAAIYRAQDNLVLRLAGKTVLVTPEVTSEWHDLGGYSDYEFIVTPPSGKIITVHYALGVTEILKLNAAADPEAERLRLDLIYTIHHLLADPEKQAEAYVG